MTGEQHRGQAVLAPAFAHEMEEERRDWQRLVTLARRLTPAECMEPGYYADQPWSVRDVIAHVGTWLAEGQIQLERIHAGSYEGHEIDVDAMNAGFLEGMRGQPWEVAWVQAHAARTRLLDEWYHLREPTDEAAWWIQKSGPEHYAEHLERLASWTEELIARRQARTSSDR